MSRDGYLPPDVNYSDLPGNRPEDIAWEKITDQLADDYVDTCDTYNEECDHSLLLQGDGSFWGCALGITKVVAGKLMQCHNEDPSNCPYFTNAAEHELDQWRSER